VLSLPAYFTRTSLILAN